MKKITYCAAAALAAAMMMGSCQQSAPKAHLETEIDTLSYAIGVANTQGLKDYLTMRLGVDSTQMDQFLKGLIEGAMAGDSKAKAAYYAGIQIGQQVSNQMVKGLNYELTGNDSTDVVSVNNFLAGFIEAVKGENTLYTVEEAGSIAQEKIQAVKKQLMESTYGENKKAGEEYIAKMAKEEGVEKLPSGVLYKVITKGNGPVPADTSRVKVHYEGTLIDGTVFDSSIKRGDATTFRCNQVIKGWTDALTNMPVGSEWMVYIPQELAYGERETGLIKPFSALTFKIQLISIEE